MELSRLNAPTSDEQDLFDIVEAEPARGSHANGDDSSADSADDPSFADRAGDRARQAWDTIQMAFPRLMGQPGYWSPRRPFTPAERPFDPDDLPLEAERSEHERLAAEQIAQAAAAARNPENGLGRRGWRSVTRLLRMDENPE